MAPFTSMYFDQFGGILACCLNVSHPIGSYPAQSVAEAWTGPQMAELRSALSAGDFSRGCASCHQSISAGNFRGVFRTFDELLIDDKEKGQDTQDQSIDEASELWPQLLEFSLSNRCNLACTMCSGYCSSTIRRQQGLAPLPDLYDDRFVEQLKPFLERVRWVKFYGGEPLLIPINFSIMEELAKLNPGAHVGITTNGTVWSDRVQQLASSLRFSISVSIDGATAETFESIRAGARFEQVMASIRSYRQLPNSQLSLAVCPMLQNWNEIPDLVRLAEEIDACIGFNVVRVPHSHSLASGSAELLDEVVAAWTTAYAEIGGGVHGSSTGTNLRNFAGIIAEVATWAAEARPTAAVSVRLGGQDVPRQGSERSRRDAWIRVLHRVLGVADPRADRRQDESDFREIVDELVARMERDVSSDKQGPALARALAAEVQSAMNDDAIKNFEQFGLTLGRSPVSKRILQLVDLPPRLIAETVLSEDPRRLALRLDSYFPPTPD